ncbi:hypothetical protein LINPERPRIM_LOCUS21978 [Linum perenne]
MQGCLGALDKTIINVRIPTTTRSRYHTRKGTTSINYLGVVNQNLQFTYCLSSWEGSAHDNRVLRDALSRLAELVTPLGNYYLCDAGF